MSLKTTRRTLLTQAGALASAASLSPAAAAAAQAPADAKPFRFCLNMSTIRGQELKLTDDIDIAAKAGYDAVEPWIGKLDAFVQTGGSLKDLRKRIADHGLTVESAIGFAEWIVDDEARRGKGLEEARRTMDIVAQIGGTRIAAPPAGATGQADLNLAAAAERYHALAEIGRQIGVTPQVEVWGFSKCLSKLGETAFVAAESRHPSALMLLDVYHLYKGGSEFAGLKLFSGAGMQVFHINDYPAAPPRATIDDAARVYPGDGVAPLDEILRTLHGNGFRGALSLELFNRDYWKQDAFDVARTGLQKTRDAVARALRM